MAVLETLAAILTVAKTAGEAKKLGKILKAVLAVLLQPKHKAVATYLLLP